MASVDCHRPIGLMADDIHRWQWPMFICFVKNILSHTNSVGVKIQVNSVVNSDNICVGFVKYRECDCVSATPDCSS